MAEEDSYRWQLPKAQQNALRKAGNAVVQENKLLPDEVKVEIPFDGTRTLPGALWKRREGEGSYLPAGKDFDAAHPPLWKGEPGGIGVLMVHPHPPSQGGNMNNPLVVFSTQEIHMFEQRVSATLRFDYGKHGIEASMRYASASRRPVNMKEYATEERIAEVQKEMEAAIAFLRKEGNVRTVTLWGYSFGTMTVVNFLRDYAAKKAKGWTDPDGDLGNVILLGGPGAEGVEKAIEAIKTGEGNAFPWSEQNNRHLLFVGGETDDLTQVEEQRKLYMALQENLPDKLTTDLFMVEDVDHFYGTRWKDGRPWKWTRVQKAVEAVAAEVLSAVVPGDQEMGPPMPDEWRTHPEDEKLYSFTDLKKKYKKEFSEAEIKEYWETEMITALQQREEAQKRMEEEGFSGDPEEQQGASNDEEDKLDGAEPPASGAGALAAKL